MVLKILLDDDSFCTLRRLVPPHSRLISVLEAAVPVGGSSVAISCSGSEARALLLYAEQPPKLVTLIQEALRSAELSQ
jgi:hypothetical protein